MQYRKLLFSVILIMSACLVFINATTTLTPFLTVLDWLKVGGKITADTIEVNDAIISGSVSYSSVFTDAISINTDTSNANTPFFLEATNTSTNPFVLLNPDSNNIFDFRIGSDKSVTLRGYIDDGTQTVKIATGSGTSYFNGGGNVGIGTATPTVAMLQVAGTGYYGSDVGIYTAPVTGIPLTVEGTAAWNGTINVLRSGTATTIIKLAQDDGGGGIASVHASDGSVNHSLYGRVTYPSYFCKLSSSFLGIGKTTPNVKLDIAGDIANDEFTNGDGNDEIIYLTQDAWADSTIASDTTVTNILPAGYVIDYIIFKNTTANAITGFDVGFSDGGGEIVASGGISASDEGSFTINQKIDDFDAADTIYISATGWNSANLIIRMKFKRDF